jgi:trk system potassium uptake protein TrkH
MKLSIKKKILQYCGYIMPVAGIFAFVSLFLKYGFYLSDNLMVYLLILDEIIAGIFVITLLTNFILSENKWQYFKQSPFEFILLFLFILSIILEEVISIEEPHYLLRRSTSHSFIKLYFVLIQVYIIINAVISLAKTREKWLFFSLSPARVLVLSYLFVILTGMFMLKLPKATYDPISWIDALFTSTSAVCITGLTTLNVSEIFTFEGQVFLLILIQLGGLGIITLTSFIALFIQRGFRLKEQIIVQEILDDENFSSLTSILKAIVLITFITELIGAVGLYFSWKNLGLPEFERIFSAVFHSVSAYCNAGFSIFPHGLQTAGYNFNTVSLILIMVLIVSGGIGFYTISDILSIGEIKMVRKNGLTPQSKIILLATLFLIIIGALLVWLISLPQWKDLSFGKQIMNAFFLSITSRTAGFSIVEIGNIAIPALMVIILLMYIGGAPNSSSGGIKITSGVILLTSFMAFVRGKNRVEIGWNTIPMTTVRRAFIVFIVSILLIFFALFVLSLTEDKPFFDLFFEVVSAFGTVGLSRGITSELSYMGRIMIILVMFAGRIGLFTFAIAMTEEKEVNGYYFPEINLMVG